MPKTLSVKNVSNGFIDGGIASLGGVIGGALIGPVGVPVGLMASSAFIKNDAVKHTAFAIGAIGIGGILVSMFLGGMGDKSQGVQ